ncbi:hypothetical protein FACS1894120_3100 [Clostridia bacterium]|nr:hypothetical protein FACS1894120_3100 [Clostridia bacterium]
MDNNTIETYKHKIFGEIEVLVEDGIPLFAATDCAKMLAYANPYKAIADHCPHLTKREVGAITGYKADGTPAIQWVRKNFITESDLYRLIFCSRLPAARAFEDWVCGTVLPQIRKFGGYIDPAILADSKRVKQLEKQLIAEQKRNNLLQQKSDFLDDMLHSKCAVPVTVIAKAYGMTAADFNILLHDLKIQYHCGGVWVLYAKYAGYGFTCAVRELEERGYASCTTYWTEKGITWLQDVLAENDFFPQGLVGFFDDLEDFEYGD